MSSRKLFILLGILFSTILAACSPADEGNITPEPAVELLPGVVSAAGVVVPEQQALLSIMTGGIVDEVFISKGDRVSSGQVLVKLEGSQGQLAAVSAAELELKDAQLALEALYKDTELAAAAALHDAERAERELEDLKDRELVLAQAEQTVADARKAVDSAERRLAILTRPPTQYALDQVRGNILLAEKQYEETLDQIADLEWQYRKTSSNKKLPEAIRKDILRKIRQALKGLEVKRSQEHLSLENARARYNELLEPPDPIDVDVAEAELLTTEALLQEAERESARVISGPKPGEVALLEARIARGRRDSEIYSAGPNPDDVTLAEARIENAEAQLAAAQAAIADQELTAPFDGVVSVVHVNPGEWVAPGSPVLLIGNLDQLQVETTDLGEIDVAQIRIADPARVTFDSLPDLELEGTVVQIAPKSDEGAGVNFPVIIALNQIPAQLRWGMTAFVDIAID